MTIYVPTLSEDAWVSDGKLQGSYLISHLLESDYSQTIIYKGKVSSLGYIFSQTPDDPDRTLSAMQNMLKTYFSRYYTDVTVDVKKTVHSDNPNQVDFQLYVAYTDNNGIQQSLSDIIETTSGKINNTIQVNNTGVL